MHDSIQKIINEYKKSIIQSEEEVRSKLIVPIIDVLGYPSYFRAEEFPVYGFEGGKKLPAKNADYVLFSNKEFAHHRTFTQKHSLLVVEAKKPGEIPEVLGQPEYYTVWTRAVAYLVIDGVNIKGYFYNDINADLEVIDCTIEDLPGQEEIWKFSYDNILQIKQKGRGKLESLTLAKPRMGILEENNRMDGVRLVDANTVNSLKEEDLNDFPEDSLQFMRESLGKNADGLTKVQLMARFINTTDALLQNNLRYDVPAYIFKFPRNTYVAQLFINNMVIPIESGEVTEFYWNDYERFVYESKYMQIDILNKNSKLFDFEIGFHVLDNQVSDRLAAFEIVKKILIAKNISVILGGSTHRMLVLPSGKPRKMWKSKTYICSMCDFWCNGLEQMKAIEEFYEIKFKLSLVTGEDNLNELYDAISFVYDGIVLNENCEITLPGGMTNENIDIEEPIILEENKKLPLKPRFIQGKCFEPYESWLLPGEIHMQGTREGDIVKASGCCRYKIVEAEEQRNSREEIRNERSW